MFLSMLWIRSQLVVVYIPDKISFGLQYLHMLTVSVEVIFLIKLQNIVYRYGL